MKRPAHGATLKQYAYAKKLLNADGPTKKDIARSVGYSLTIANKASEKIENTEGFHNAVIALANESNNLVMSVMAEYKARGLKGFSNSELTNALSAISVAWERFNKQSVPQGSQDPTKNRLKQVIMQRVENQVINNNTPAPEVKEAEVVEAEVLDDDPMDF